MFFQLAVLILVSVPGIIGYPCPSNGFLDCFQAGITAELEVRGGAVANLTNCIYRRCKKINVYANSTLALSNVTFIDSQSTGSGNPGAIYVSSGSLEAFNVSFRNIQADVGAAIRSFRGKITLESVFSSNLRGRESGGAFFFYDSHAMVRNLTCTLSQTVEGFGGCAYIEGGTFTCEGCLFEANFVGNNINGGGAVAVKGMASWGIPRYGTPQRM